MQPGDTLLPCGGGNTVLLLGTQALKASGGEGTKLDFFNDKKRNNCTRTHNGAYAGGGEVG